MITLVNSVSKESDSIIIGVSSPKTHRIVYATMIKEEKNTVSNTDHQGLHACSMFFHKK